MIANIQSPLETTLRGDYVLLTADTLHLLLPRHEVGAVEYLEGRLEAGDEAGLLRLQGDESRRPFAALSAQMAALPHCPPGRFLVTTLAESDDLGWCWSELKMLIDVELRVQPLPAVLIAPETPVDRYAEVDGKVAYLCSAQRVCSFVLGEN